VLACGSNSGGADGGGNGFISESDASAAETAAGDSAGQGIGQEAEAPNDAASSSDSSLPPIDRSTSIASLTNAQLGELCDWLATTYGGYNVTTQCTSGMITTPTNQAQCIATSFQFRCQVTVGQFEDCMLAQLPSHGCVRGQAQCSYQFC
jgi:hypothetical protein